MTNGHLPQPEPEMDDINRPQPEPDAAPPPLTAVRVKGPGAKGLNKPAIIIAAGGATAVILVLASNGMSADPSRKPSETKPMMSDPARPEMAQGALQKLPTDYHQAAIQQAQTRPAAPPLLGPPLPGDIAAFAPDGSTSNGHGAPSESQGRSVGEPLDPALEEAVLADRSQLFFSVRQEAKTNASSEAQPPPANAPLTALSRQVSDTQPASTSNERSLFPGSVISASLVTEINSESPGPVIAQVTQTVYDSATGHDLLIPQGARLIGDYKSATRYGQSRIVVMWSRIIMPDGQEIVLDETALDPSGTAGVTGKVDNHWLDVFGAAALGTLISIGVASTEDPQLTYSGIGAMTRDPVDAAIAEGVQRGASAVTNRVVERSLALPPTIRVEAGKRISVVVTRRLDI